jgi:preprotein translocase subunit YajC
MTIFHAGPVFAMGAVADSGNMWVQFVPFAIVLAIFYFIILLPMKRKQQKVQTFLDSLKVNDRVVTTGGIYGQITKLGDQTVQVQVADKVRIEVARASIGGYQGQDPVQEPVGESASSSSSSR